MGIYNFGTPWRSQKEFVVKHPRKVSDEPATTDETNNTETRHVFVLTHSQAKTTKGKKETLPSIQEELKADQGEMGETSNPAASPKMRG